MRVVFCTPSHTRPVPAYFEAMEKSIPLIEAAGWDHAFVAELGNPYISGARAIMIGKALAAGADVVVTLDHDLGWRPRDLLTLLETSGDVVAGTYRFKKDEEQYMGLLDDDDGAPAVREDGCIRADRVPAGFLKLTREAIERFAEAYPHLRFERNDIPSVDIFNHGAIDGVWYGEDYAFSKRWIEKCGDIWIIPDLDIDHHAGGNCYAGNFHEFLMRQPGGARDPARLAA